MGWVEGIDLTSKPLKETKTFKILKEISLANRGLTNKELAKRLAGVSDSSYPEYRRLMWNVCRMDERGYLKTVGYEPDPLNQDHPIRDITEKGEEYLKLARKGAVYGPKIRS